MLRTEEGHYGWLLEALSIWRATRQEAPRCRWIMRRAWRTIYSAASSSLKMCPNRRGELHLRLRLRALEAQLEAEGLPRSAAILWAAVAMNEFHRLRIQVSPHPEAAGLLSALGERYQLAAITNGNIHLKRQPLAAYFPVAIAAGELLAPKPEHTPFLTALSRLNVTPECAMHVGDSWKEVAFYRLSNWACTRCGSQATRARRCRPGYTASHILKSCRVYWISWTVQWPEVSSGGVCNHWSSFCESVSTPWRLSDEKAELTPGLPYSFKRERTFCSEALAGPFFSLSALVSRICTGILRWSAKLSIIWSNSLSGWRTSISSTSPRRLNRPRR